MQESNFFLPEGYSCNEQSHTLDDASRGNYWTQQRIVSAQYFQWHVYRLAKKLAREHCVRSVLDVGSGPPLKLSKFLSDIDTEVTLVDQPSVAALAHKLAPAFRFLPSNIEHGLPKEIGKFDLVIFADVVEHLFDPTPCLRDIHTCLAEEGHLVISTPERDLLYGPSQKKSGHPSHVREWNRTEFLRFVDAVGFDVVEEHLLPQRKPASIREHIATLLARFGRPSNFISCQAYVLVKKS